MRREKTARWYPRNIDIDILTWNDEIILEEHLTIPHAGLEERPFALWPLFDLTPDWVHPQLNRSARELVKHWGDKYSGNSPLKTRPVNADLEATQLVGIINVTPDSFSDGGLCFKPENALLQAKKCVEEGATILDVGAESTTYNAINITPKEEWERLLPILYLIKSNLPNTKISLDIRNPETAQKGLEFGIDFLNDVKGFQDPKMRSLAVDAGIPIVFMHSLTIPANKAILIPEDQNPVSLIYEWGERQIDAFLKAGMKLENLIFDVGIGFGNSPSQAIRLLKNIDVFHALGVKLYLGHSRKSFLNVLTDKHFSDRDFETAVISGILAKKNIHYLRVHNVAMSKRAIQLNQLL